MLRTLILAIFLIPEIAYTQDLLPKNSMVEVSTTLGNITATGRGVVIAKDLVLTAEHVIEHNGQHHIPDIAFSDNTKRRATAIVRKWADRDLAILKVSVPDAIPAIELADDPKIELAWSYDFSGEVRQYRYCTTDRGRNYFDYSPRSGESGGPIFSGNRLIGIVSGGWFWREDHPKHTWPLRSGQLDIVREYVNGQALKAN